MYVGMLGSGEIDLEKVDEFMMNMIEESGRYLFTVVSADKNSLGGQFAEKRGLPVYYCSSLAEWEKKGDWFLGVIGPGGDDGAIKREMMKLSIAGKHGQMIYVR